MQLFACFHGFGALALGRVSPRFAWSCGPGATYDRRQLGSSESTLAHSAVVYLARRERLVRSFECVRSADVGRALVLGPRQRGDPMPTVIAPVSYTHLTLPTILLV